MRVDPLTVCGLRRKPTKEVSAGEAETRQVGDFMVEIIRSVRRTKSVSGRLRNWYTLEVRAPAHIPESELQRILQRFVEQAEAMRRKLRSFRSDEQLEQRAAHLNKALFGGMIRWRSIRFVPEMRTRFGSCSPTRGTIRIAAPLRTVPSFVLDYVIVHELAHMLEADHSSAFWELVYRYPQAERARGYLMALQMENDAVTSANVAEEEDDDTRNTHRG